MKKLFFFLWLILAGLSFAPVARAEYPISFLEMVIALLKEKATQEKKSQFYEKVNDEIKKLIEDGIGLEGTTKKHKRLSKSELQEARKFLEFNSEITGEFIVKQMDKDSDELNMDDFIKFVEDYFFVKLEKDEKTGKPVRDYKTDEKMLETVIKRREFFYDMLKEGYAYALANRGYSAAGSTTEKGILQEIKEKSESAKDVREMLYVNNLALQELIFETMQMIMFEQIALEMEAVEFLLMTPQEYYEYDYKMGSSK